MGPGALGGADNGPQVVRIGDLIADDHQGRLPPAGSQLEDILHRGVGLGGGGGDDALVAVGFAHGVQFPPVALHHNRAGLPGLGGDAAQGVVRLAPDDVELIQGGSGPQGLGDRVAAFDIHSARGPVFKFTHKNSFWRAENPAAAVHKR